VVHHVGTQTLPGGGSLLPDSFHPAGRDKPLSGLLTMLRTSHPCGFRRRLCTVHLRRRSVHALLQWCWERGLLTVSDAGEAPRPT
jgi:hypothetical protein